MQLPLAFLDAGVIESVPVDSWRQLFDAIGYPASLSGRNEITHAGIIQALTVDELSDELLQALEVLSTLGTDDGREAIALAMTDRRVPADALPQGVSELELALSLFLAQRNDAAMTEVFVRAQAQAHSRGDPRRYNEFAAKEARRVSQLASKQSELRRAVLEYSRDNDRGEHVDVRAFEDDGVYVFHVLRSDRVKKPLAVVPGRRSSRATIAYTPVLADSLRYDAVLGRLRVASRSASMVPVYRRLMGLTLFNDEAFFNAEPICDLEVLRSRGAAALSDHSVPGIGRVWMTECLLEFGDRNLVHVRSADCFRHMADLGLAFGEGQIVQAKLKLEVVGPSTRPVTVRLSEPNRIEINPVSQEALVDEYLTHIRVRALPRAAGAVDLWSLYPWRHPVDVWRNVFGGAVDELVRAGALVPVRLDAVSAPEEPSAGRVLGVTPVGDGQYYGISRVPELPSRSLSSTDLQGLELRPEQFRHYLCRTLQTTRFPEVSNDTELLDLGEIDVAAQALRLFFALRPISEGTGQRQRAVSGASHPLLLMPSARATSELAHIPLPTAIPQRQAVIRDAVAACGLGDQVPAIYTAPERARLVVDTRFGKIWVDGVPIDDLRAETHPFRFVELVAKRSPSPISSDDIATALSEAREDGNQPARTAKNKANRIITSSMARAGRAFTGDPFPSGPPGHYRCVLPAYVK